MMLLLKTLVLALWTVWEASLCSVNAGFAGQRREEATLLSLEPEFTLFGGPNPGDPSEIVFWTLGWRPSPWTRLVESRLAHGPVLGPDEADERFVTDPCYPTRGRVRVLVKLVCSSWVDRMSSCWPARGDSMGACGYTDPVPLCYRDCWLEGEFHTGECRRLEGAR